MPNLYDIGCDVYKRWVAVSQIIQDDFGDTSSVLDVGGAPGSLFYEYMPSCTVTPANPQYGGPSGADLPYEDGQFDVAMSVDTLEHVPATQREKFLAEMWRVAKKGVVLAAPFDTEGVVEAEALVFALTRNLFLREHIEHGLPSFEETKKFLEGLGPKALRTWGNDSLQSWVSWLTLHNLEKGRTNLSGLNQFLNKKYRPFMDEEPTYRKIILLKK